MIVNAKEKTKARYRNIRAGLMARGLNLHRMARSHGWPLASTYAAASGARSGPRILAIRRQLEKEAGL